MVKEDVGGTEFVSSKCLGVPKVLELLLQYENHRKTTFSSPHCWYKFNVAIKVNMEVIRALFLSCAAHTEREVNKQESSYINKSEDGQFNLTSTCGLSDKWGQDKTSP